MALATTFMLYYNAGEDIAAELGVKPEQVRSWKHADKWDAQTKKVLQLCHGLKRRSLKSGVAVKVKLVAGSVLFAAACQKVGVFL